MSLCQISRRRLVQSTLRPLPRSPRMSGASNPRRGAPPPSGRRQHRRRSSRCGRSGARAASQHHDSVQDGSLGALTAMADDRMVATAPRGRGVARHSHDGVGGRSALVERNRARRRLSAAVATESPTNREADSRVVERTVRSRLIDDATFDPTDIRNIERPAAEGSSQSDHEEGREDPETEELSRLRCTSERTEVVAERETRRQRRCADYPGFAFGSSIFGSDTIMKFNIIRNELQNIKNSQLKRVSIGEDCQKMCACGSADMSHGAVSKRCAFGKVTAAFEM